MRLPVPPPREYSEHVLPLINIVFLLLIFFMLSATLEPPLPFAVTTPESQRNSPGGPTEDVVVVAADGRVGVGGQEIRRGELVSVAVRERVGRGGRPVKLKMDANTDARLFLDIIEDLKQAGIEQIVLLTVPDSK